MWKKSISLYGHFAQGDVEGAKVVYREATEVEADCIEAIYNLALSHKRQGELGEALATFKKISSLQPNNIEVSFQVILFFRDSWQHEMIELINHPCWLLLLVVLSIILSMYIFIST